MVGGAGSIISSKSDDPNLFEFQAVPNSPPRNKPQDILPYSPIKGTITEDQL